MKPERVLKLLSVNCDAQLTESNFKTHSRKACKKTLDIGGFFTCFFYKFKIYLDSIIVLVYYLVSTEIQKEMR